MKQNLIKLLNCHQMRIFKQAIDSIGNSFNRDTTPENKQRAKSSEQVFEIDAQYMTPDFLFQDSTAKKPQKNHLSKAFFYSLSDTENKLFNTKSVDLLDTVIGMYQKCIEWYDGKQDPIKFYFKEKIQKVLGDKNLLQIKLQQDQLNLKLKQLIEVPELQKKISIHKEDEFHDVVDYYYSIESRRSKTETAEQLLSLRNQVEKERAIRKEAEQEKREPEVEEVVREMKQGRAEQEKMISNDLKCQEKSIQERLKQRIRSKR